MIVGLPAEPETQLNVRPSVPAVPAIVTPVELGKSELLKRNGYAVFALDAGWVHVSWKDPKSPRPPVPGGPAGPVSPVSPLGPAGPIAPVNPRGP